MHLRRVAVPSALILGLVLVPAAEAKLPTPAVTTIVPGKSVAGVKLGMKLGLAKQTWGAGFVCGPGATGPGSTQCTWSKTPNAKPDRGPKLILLSIGGKVRAITVNGGTGGPAIKAFRTGKGIGVGSTIAALNAAYPTLATPEPDNSSLGGGATITWFSTKGGRVRSIQVGSPV